jgi:hypothetical protein
MRAATRALLLSSQSTEMGFFTEHGLSDCKVAKSVREPTTQIPNSFCRWETALTRHDIRLARFLLRTDAGMRLPKPTWLAAQHGMGFSPWGWELNLGQVALQNHI